MDRMPRSLRYLLAILIGPIVGELAGVPIAQLLKDLPSSIGIPVVGGYWPLAVSMVLLPAGKGFVTGGAAGSIAGRHGTWLGALAAAAPFALVALVDFVAGRRLLDPAATLSLIAGLLPAAFCGYLVTEYLTGGAAAPLRALARLSMLAFYPCALAFHIYTMAVATNLSGLKAGFVTAVAPILSEVFWFVRSIYETGAFLNLYTGLMLGLLALPTMAAGLYAAAALIARHERSRGGYGAAGAAAPLGEARG